MRLQAMFRVAVIIVGESGRKPPYHPFAVRYAYARPFGRTIPNIVCTGIDVGTARIDQALPGAVIEDEGRRAGAALDGGPRARSAGGSSFFDFIAPPGARDPGQRSFVFGVGQYHPAAGKFHIALCRRSYPRGRRVADDAILAPRQKAVVEGIDRRARETGD